MNKTAMYPSLEDRVILISGGATGIGQCFVQAFAEQGAKVGFMDIDEAASRALVQSLSSARHTPFFVAADLTRIDALKSAIDQIRQKLGAIQVLVNNAANDKRHTIESTTVEFWDQALAVNLRHQFFAAQSVMEDMKQLGGGSIINLGSVSWMLKQGGMPCYTTSKAAIQGLTRSLARDLGGFNIRVNTLVPGWVMTEKQLSHWVDEAALESIRQGQCLSQPLMPEAIAHMALFLAADESKMCTAQDFIVDGGWT